MELHFFKYEGAENTFVLIEDYSLSFPAHPSIISYLCDSKKGIGADGILLLQPSRHATIKMKIFNQDGTEATTCGNGLRCAAKHLARPFCHIETHSGISHAIVSNSLIQVSLPFCKIIRPSLHLPYGLMGSLVYSGTPHLVIFVHDLYQPELFSTCMQLKKMHTNLGRGINVNLAKITRNAIFVRSFEKGIAEETFSCGSGGGAVSLLYCYKYQKNHALISFMRSSLLFFLDKKKLLWMQGPARQILRGTISILSTK